MNSRVGDLHVPAVKDEGIQRAIPSEWRDVIKKIVRVLIAHDYQLSSGISGVAPVTADTAAQIGKYIEGYGAVLAELPDETWNSSVCMWDGSQWDAIIDLWTESEGRSDLVLSLQIEEDEAGFIFNVCMVYVP